MITIKVQNIISNFDGYEGSMIRLIEKDKETTIANLSSKDNVYTYLDGVKNTLEYFGKTFVVETTEIKY